MSHGLRPQNRLALAIKRLSAQQLSPGYCNVSAEFQIEQKEVGLFFKLQTVVALISQKLHFIDHIKIRIARTAKPFDNRLYPVRLERRRQNLSLLRLAIVGPFLRSPHNQNLALLLYCKKEPRSRLHKGKKGLCFLRRDGHNFSRRRKSFGSCRCIKRKM